MHPILTEHPRWRELQERRATAEAARARALESVAEWEREYHRAKAEHDRQVAAAAAGEADPPGAWAGLETPKPAAGEVLARVSTEQTAVRDAEREFMRRYGPELHAELAARERDLLDDAAKRVEKLRRDLADTVDELDQLTRAGVQLARAHGLRGQLRERATLADVVAAVLEGGRLVADLPGTPQPPAPAPPGTGAETRARMDAARAGFAASRSPAAAALRGRR